LYFENGAIEVWICNENGDISFYNSEGKLEQFSSASELPIVLIIIGGTICITNSWPLLSEMKSGLLLIVQRFPVRMDKDEP
jgi:hypothetical protein